MFSDKCMITNMLNELKTTRSSMKTQTMDITDVLDKSNNALLQIESSRSIKPAMNDNNYIPYTYNKETVNALTKIFDKFMCLLSGIGFPNLVTESNNFEEFLVVEKQKMEYLGCNVRKLLAIWDTVQQMRLALERQELDASSDDGEADNDF